MFTQRFLVISVNRTNRTFEWVLSLSDERMLFCHQRYNDMNTVFWYFWAIPVPIPSEFTLISAHASGIGASIRSQIESTIANALNVRLRYLSLTDSDEFATTFAKKISVCALTDFVTVFVAADVFANLDSFSARTAVVCFLKGKRPLFWLCGMYKLYESFLIHISKICSHRLSPVYESSSRILHVQLFGRNRYPKLEKKRISEINT